jgi:hypothetical protein
MRRTFTLAIVLFFSLVVWAVWPRSTANPLETPQNAPQGVSGLFPDVDPIPELIIEFPPQWDFHDLARADFIEKVLAWEAAVSEWERGVEIARVTATRAVKAPVHVKAPGGSTVGQCSGFAIPDYIIQRESGGNPSAYNPSGAYGCAQTLLTHYSGGSCRGLDPYTVEGQRECVNRLSNGGTNLDPWAATR